MAKTDNQHFSFYGRNDAELARFGECTLAILEHGAFDVHLELFLDDERHEHGRIEIYKDSDWVEKLEIEGKADCMTHAEIRSMLVDSIHALLQNERTISAC